MGEITGISWCDHTFNPWRGCTRVSPGCQHCYAETMSGRNPKTLGVWGPRGLRAPAAESYWRQPLKWHRDAIAAGVRRRVFCASLADVFEGDDTMPAESRAVVHAARNRLWSLIDSTPGLDWLLLTKRPENIARMLPPGWLTSPRPNVWLGTSVEDEPRAERIDHLRIVPAAIRFLSLEPLLGPLDNLQLDGISWAIIGGESGAHARPMEVAWVRSIIAQCAAARVACFVKQLGAHPLVDDAYRIVGCGRTWPVSVGFESEHPTNPLRPPYRALLAHRAGADPTDWPHDLRVQQFPGGAA